jgi:hypothetical protein
VRRQRPLALLAPVSDIRGVLEGHAVLVFRAVESLIDVDDSSTWPGDVRTRVDEVSSRLHGSRLFAGDLELDDQQEVAFRKLLGARPVLAYHFTRLLDPEVERIRGVEGLRPLTRELVEGRIHDALDGGHVTAQQAERLLATHVFAQRDGRGRRDQVCLALGRRPLVSGDGVRELLGMWGGEAQYASSFEMREFLRRLGRPSVVVAAIDLSASGRHDVRPGVLKTFVGTDLGLSGAGADIMYRAQVPAAAIVEIWQPGVRSYDRFRNLPRDG